MTEVRGTLDTKASSVRILFLGENWYGSCARACCYALRRLGCCLLDFDNGPEWRNAGLRLVRRLGNKWIIRLYNDAIMEAAQKFQPDMVLAFKGPLIEPSTLRALKQKNVVLSNYYPDRLVFARGTMIEKSLPEYDCVFDTKRKWDGDTESWLRVKSREFLPHGYDPELHRPTPVDARDVGQYGCDVSVVANYSERKMQLLEALIRLQPRLNLRIWGNGWRGRSRKLNRLFEGWAPTGDQYVRIVQCARINLGLLGINSCVKDETTTRTYEIPACRAFMLHERTEEVLGLYAEDREMACFGSAEELAGKIAYFLSNPEERNAIAREGYRRCVPAYSYDNRMAHILRWYHGLRIRPLIKSA